MQEFKIRAAFFAGIIILTACGQQQAENKETATDEVYKYMLLQDLNYRPAVIKPGTSVEILANLGGPESSGDTVYYYQFIVKNTETKDTILVLCPVITIDPAASGVDNITSVSPVSYNPSKGVVTAYYAAIDSADLLLLNPQNIAKMTEGKDAVDINHLLNTGNAVNMVVLDKNDTENRVMRFSTVVGKLNFKEIPW